MSFSPTLISSCKGLYLADTGVLNGSDAAASNGDGVKTWQDQLGANNATQATSGNRPIYRTNALGSLPAIQPDGVDDYLGLANLLSGASAATLMAVVKCAADPAATVATSASPIGLTGTDASADHYPFTDGNVYHGAFSTARKSTGNPSVALDQWHILTISSAANAWNLWINETLHFSTATNTVGIGSTPAIGKAGGSAVFFGGWIYGLAMFNAALNAAERLNVRKYFLRRVGPGLLYSKDTAFRPPLSTPFIRGPLA